MTVMLEMIIGFYMGLLATPIGSKEITFGKDGLRKEILERKQSVLAYTGNKDKGMIVIIKPSKKSNYKNVITDEMAI
jgi:hypothetical protein